MSPQDTDGLFVRILGPNLEAATQRLIAYAAVGSALIAFLISIL